MSPTLVLPSSSQSLRRAGDIHKEDRAWKHLFHAWMPRSGYEPTGDPTMEI